MLVMQVSCRRNVHVLVVSLSSLVHAKIDQSRRSLNCTAHYKKSALPAIDKMLHKAELSTVHLRMGFVFMCVWLHKV